MFQEFKEFIAKGNVMDMAIGVIMGTAFGAIVKSLVSDVIMPPIGLLLGGVDFANLYVLLEEGDPGKPYASLAEAQAAGAISINYGVFIDTVISFLIVALVVFVIVRYINQLKRKEEPAPPAEPMTKECPFCLSSVAIEATRCAYCTSDLAAGG